MRVPYVRNIIVGTANGSSAWVLDKPQTNAHIAFFYIECVCNAWFTFEILVSRLTAQLNCYKMHMFCDCRSVLYHRQINVNLSNHQ